MVVRANLLASSLESLHLAQLKADELALASELVLLALASEVLSEALYIQQQSVSLLS